ncbi:BTAD domain-containing putative transcriptional regulator [Nocardia sp. NBC_00511]|uniref:BTAD domain-containing putative transcriptional regulator n=1 Tax=Nocardia sp. NBC_00511 TaxID=2903591 RepID=UPI0030DF1BC8
MEFGILGPVQARDDEGAPIAVGGPQVRALLALLVLDSGRVVGRESLIDGLYGEQPPGDAGHALQSQVSRLRRALRKASEDTELVESTAAGYRLAVEREAVDAHRFTRLAEQGRKALRDRDPATAVALLDEAIGLWRGQALVDVLDAPFAGIPADRLTEQRLAAEEDRAEASLAVGEQHAVVAALSELVARQPLRERARALLMRALYAAGRQADALECFEEGRRLLADELGADPSAELAEAHLSILRADEVAAVADRRLPIPLTSFVGRDSELARLVPLLAQSRLVTLIGPGGTGKTRLAVEAGNKIRGEVCFVDLAPLVDGVQVVQAVAAALGGRDLAAHTPAAPRDTEARLITMLADRPLTLILDNCEQVILEAARLTHRLLTACPALRILATSRESLRITGESSFPLGQLPIAPTDSALAEQLSSPAVRLFADRAAAVRPGFTVDAGTIAMVARICTRLDGLPLAIELAAARLRTLDLPEIDARLTDRFRLLARGDRTAEPRHQTLQAVVAWSWDLLDPAEQALAERFSVFAGGATAAAVREVCARTSIEDHPFDVDFASDIEDLLADLADKSLLEVTAGRYRMLETIREFARTRSMNSDAHEQLQRTHAEHFTALADSADPLLRSSAQLTHLALLTADYDNLQSALHWSAGADPRLAARLIAAQSWYWWLTGRPGEAAEIANRLLPELDPTLDAEQFALCVAVAARGCGDVGPALAQATSAIAASPTALHRPHVVFLLAIVGGLLPGNPADLRRLLGADPWSRAFLRLGDGLGLLMSGRAADSEPEFHSALTEFRTIGDRWAIAATLDKLAVVAEQRGDHPTALTLIDEAIALNTDLACIADTADLLTRRGDIRTATPAAPEALAAARTDYLHAADLARTIGATDMRANALRGLADLERPLTPTSARDHYTAVLSLPADGSINLVDAQARSHIGLARLSLSESATPEANSHAHTALNLALATGLHPIAATAAETLAAAALTDGNPRRATALLGAAESLRGLPSTGDSYTEQVRAATREELGDKEFNTAYAEGTAMSPDQIRSLGNVG